MFPNLSPAKQASIFTALVLSMSVGMMFVVRAAGDGAAHLTMFTPLLAVLVMMFIVSKDRPAEGKMRFLGLRPLGLSLWPLALLGTTAVGLAAFAIALLLPSAEFGAPHNWPLYFGDFAFELVVASVTFTLGEEIGWRGYLLPKLRPYGDARAMLIVGIVHATWHMPLLLGTDVEPLLGNHLVVIPMFYATLIACSFFFGLMRIRSNSIWPAIIAHSAHNATWTLTGAFLVASSPAAEAYVAGDAGIVIIVGSVLGALALAVHRSVRVVRREQVLSPA